MKENIKINRRDFLRGLTVTAAGTLMPGLSAYAAGDSKGARLKRHIKSKQAVFAQFGGETTQARKKVYFRSFENATDVTVVSPLEDFGKFIAMTKKGPQQWDTLDADGFFAIELQEMGLLQTLPKWVEKCDMVDSKWQPYIGGGYAYCVQMGFLPHSFSGKGPSSWADFWDVKKYPGKRGWPSAIYAGTAEAALLADGVPKDKLYPLDFDRAFKKLDELRPHMIFWDTYAQGQQMLVQGSVSLLNSANGRFFEILKGGMSVTQVWNEAILYPWSAMPVPKNAPNPGAIFALIDWMSDARRQAAFAQKTAYGPNNSKAFLYLSGKEKENMPNSEEHRKVALTVDPGYLAKIDSEYFERYSKWVSGS